MNKLVTLSALLLLWSCHSEKTKEVIKSEQWVMVLGIAQDAGYPQIACEKECCVPAFNNPNKIQKVSALGVVDLQVQQQFLVDATPDITSLMRLLRMRSDIQQLHGILLTHAHIGHYSGLMYLGREAMGAHSIPVYAMPKMSDFLRNNGPWNQLVSLQNIQLQPLQNGTPIQLTPQLKVTPLLVPHRDEFSETVGYRIQGTQKSLLYIPDIDKWSKWHRNIVDEVKKVDYALLDATFFANGEIARDMSEVPHPFIEETQVLFKDQPRSLKQKIIFIHLNHSNPALHSSHEGRKQLEAEGFRFAHEGMQLPL